MSHEERVIFQTQPLGNHYFLKFSLGIFGSKSITLECLTIKKIILMRA